MKNIFVATALLVLSFSANAQDITADQIIDKYLTAVGGKEAIMKIQDMSISSTAETQRGAMENEVKVKMPNKFTTVTYMMGNEVNRQICDGTKISMLSGWGGNQQTSVIEGNDATMMILASNPFPELMYDQLKISRNVVGRDTVNSAMAWKVEFATSEGKKWSESFDMATGLKLKKTSTMRRPQTASPASATPTAPNAGTPAGGGQARPEGGMRSGGAVNVVYDNYKEIKDGGGVKIPFSRSQKMGQMDMKFEIQSVKINKGLKDGAFEIK
jgi:outer membrane lipoprotein-sorting protein